MSDKRISHGGAWPVSLNGLRAFESAARHLSFTSAANELGVTQSAVSHQVKALEDRLGVKLFRRTSRGLAVTDEGLALFPTLNAAFEQVTGLIDRFDRGVRQEVLTVSAVGTFALGWLLPRMERFRQLHPFVDLRLLTNNNRVDVAGESLDCAICFGDGAWRGLEATHLMQASLSPLCSPAVAEHLHAPADLRDTTLLRSYRGQDWLTWLAAAGLPDQRLSGPVFDSSALMAQAAMRGFGVAILPLEMFEAELQGGWLIQPFTLAVSTGSYWLARLRSREPTAALISFRDWLVGETAEYCDPSR
ncbi:MULTISPECIES: LysR family transcriptional regulator [unclassified Novosphingobium]|uniref:LysR family transcriptional regulator n=1 Tax=unclassified Novosphingobium TaxID=2644732 RepID=UPI000D47F3F9|nr:MULTISPECIES: LysR family transcriptional regulator [unclassified Novosphingobium]PTR07589.1 LysR family transcriptional regulator of beta-lactamase [Novosphingobium sp. GV055]PUB00291.1 LysR family transcriptional regulator of beta-lactamase [Novosphingobium sp. GV061]PUB15332.1 LysR family transcriptional regulator of beta-lactamase [Novosphingobium sp. GV079]PUB39208.1 LysR family transcriptional regulator of beta-lactamase [Novosphingobium sp. GV027]